MPANNQLARRNARLAQGAAALCLAGAAAAAIIPRAATPEVPLGIDTVNTPVIHTSADTRPPASEADLARSALVMNTLVERKERPGGAAPKAAAQPDKVDDAPATTTSTPVAGTWHFVGTIFTPNSAAAVINDESGKQHILFKGDTLNGTTVATIEPDHVMLSSGGQTESRRLDLDARPESLLPDAPSNVMAATVNVGGANLPPEYASVPPGFDAWPAEQQQEWRSRRETLIRQQFETSGGNGKSRSVSTPPARPRPATPIRKTPTDK